MGLEDCNFFQLPQVNIPQHAFSMQHICKVNNFLEQTSTDSKVTIDMESNVNESGREEYFNESDDLQKPIADGYDKKIYKINNSPDVNSKQAEVTVAKIMPDMTTGDRLCTFTRIYGELKLNNAMKQALGQHRDNVKYSELELMNNQNINDFSMSSKSNHDIRHKDQQQYYPQQMTNLISRTKINDRQKKNGGNGSKSEAREDNQVCYNKCSSIVNHKIINKSNYICDNEQSSKSSYFQTNAQVATCLSESDVNDNYDDKDSNDGNYQYLYDNTDIEKRLKRYDSITTNNNSNNSTSSSLTTSEKPCTNLKSSHVKLINCSKITASGGK
ncbi:probable serine/threonine-protein kinase clkA isoform X1 [Ceratitis capitata]|uniref:Uncharacterized protein n=1 Tax=Ceratitis capitata TaxID=7213 RepID=W8B7Y1_CERCA|nr:probable serine/threonine-protein kinase clkA isoform X1 [Ceratitis capitata]XP_023158900.1 probable serine/threonine-protein kinase clkA isoform X1 [Ceratitis capitata]